MLSTQVKSFVFNGYAPVKSKRQGMSHLCRISRQFRPKDIPHLLGAGTFYHSKLELTLPTPSCITLWTESFFSMSPESSVSNAFYQSYIGHERGVIIAGSADFDITFSTAE